MEKFILLAEAGIRASEANGGLMRSLIIFLFLLAPVWAQTPLQGRWLFHPGDDSSWAATDCDEGDWSPIQVPGFWEKQGHPDLNGFAWYRLHFKTPADLPQEPFLLLGTIDDADEAYLNGERLGRTGEFPPEPASEHTTQRVYAARRSLFRSDDNVLAIRVYDATGLGGISGGLLGIYDRDTYRRVLNWGPAPKRSWNQLTTSNGLTVAVYDLESDRVTRVLPHLYRMYDEGRPVEPFIRSLSWETGEKPLEAFYVQNTHVVCIRYPSYQVYLFAPFTADKRRLYLSFGGENVGKLRIKVDGECVVSDVKRGKLRQMVLAPRGVPLEDSTLPRSQLEIDWMRHQIAAARLPIKLSPAERDVCEQSLSVLKMAQVAAEDEAGARGQIVAGLPPGDWNICWLRDGVYAILALDQVGWYEESRRALTFYLTARSGEYIHCLWKGVDYGLKVPYRISVCRYFGLGREESDSNDDGPNIELDGMGLFLLAFSDYVGKSGDRAFLEQWRATVDREVAEALLAQVAPNGLIRPESGPWEMHLPGRQNAWTSIVSCAGLRAYGQLSKQPRYLEAAERMQAAITAELVYQDSLIKGFAEAEKPSVRDFYDGGTIEAFNLGVVSRELFPSYLAAYARALRIEPRRGFARLNNPSWYTAGEWPFLSLRFALASGDRSLVDRVTQYARMNFNLIPELYGRTSENYEGSIPMVGYGAGAYLLTVGR